MNKEQFGAMSLPFELIGEIEYIKNLVLDPIWFIREFADKAISMVYYLHPFSDLTKPIEHKGETFVPIVEIAKMCYNNTFNIYPEIKTFEALKLNSDNENSFGLIGYTEDERFSLTFDNTFNNQSFEFRIDGREYYIKQFDLFLKLIEWHFNLMDESEPFIDVNTLPENPYK